MATPAPVPSNLRDRQLFGQTVVVIGGSAGIGLDAPAARAPTSSSSAAIPTISHVPPPRSTPGAPPPSTQPIPPA